MMKRPTKLQIENLQGKIREAIVYKFKAYAYSHKAETPQKLRQLKDRAFGVDHDQIERGIVSYLFTETDQYGDLFFQSVGCGIGVYANRLMHFAFDVLILEALHDAFN